MSPSRTHERGLLALFVAALLVLLVNWHWVAALQKTERINGAIDRPDVPPSLAVTSLALGPLRSMISNVLWWRATGMQQEGNYFEAIQLAHWITTLQPKLHTVWTYQAWNMAYNITADVPAPEERWRWILASIQLLRDDALRYNPREPHIQIELARIYFQKMSSVNEPQGRYYTQQWALLMSRYLRTSDRAELEGLAGAPVDILKNPTDMATLRAQTGVSALLDAASALGLDLTNFDVLTQPKSWTEAQRTLVLTPERATALATVRAAVVRRALLADLKLDAEHMLYIDKEYGPLDWRLPQAHVIYWGARESFEAYRKNPEYELALVRQAMVQSFLQGKLMFLSEKEIYTTNNLAIAPKVHDYLEYLLENKASDDVRSLAKDFHAYGAVVLYTYMHEGQARDVFKEFVEEFCTPEERKNLTFEDFVTQQAPLLLSFNSGAGKLGQQSVVVSSLLQAYVWLALGDSYRSKGYENTAKLIWEDNQKKYANNARRLLPPFEELKKTALAQALSDQSGMIPPEVQEALRTLTGGKAVEIVTPKARPDFFLFGDKHTKAAEEEQK